MKVEGGRMKDEVKSAASPKTDSAFPSAFSLQPSAF
jgi:hypothetical protein